jgi:hypothetical protein
MRLDHAGRVTSGVEATARRRHFWERRYYWAAGETNQPAARAAARQDWHSPFYWAPRQRAPMRKTRGGVAGALREAPEGRKRP